MSNRSNTSTQQVHGVNNQNQLQTLVSTPYTGSTPGATTTTNYTYDAGGNLATQATGGSNGATYAYDEADRLSTWTQTSSTGINVHKSDWLYDGLSRKKSLKESSWNGSAWVLNSMKQYVYDGMDVVQERETIYAADGVTVASTNQNNFTRIGNIGGILAKSTGTSTLTHTFFHYDGSGNVVSLTDSSQNSVAEYSYDSYGNTLTATGTQAASNAYRYSTKELHSFSGLYDYGFRFYSPSLGRWINRDPIEEDGGLNLYAIVGNSPTNFVDDYGMAPKDLNCPQLLLAIGTTTTAIEREFAKYRPKADAAGDYTSKGYRNAVVKIAGIEIPGPRKPGVKYGHYIKVMQLQSQLAALVNEYRRKCNGTIGKPVFEWANKKVPVFGTPPRYQSKVPKIYYVYPGAASSVPSINMKPLTPAQVLALGGVAVFLYVYGQTQRQ